MKRLLLGALVAGQAGLASCEDAPELPPAVVSDRSFADISVDKRRDNNCPASDVLISAEGQTRVRFADGEEVPVDDKKTLIVTLCNGVAQNLTLVAQIDGSEVALTAADADREVVVMTTRFDEADLLATALDSGQSVTVDVPRKGVNADVVVVEKE